MATHLTPKLGTYTPSAAAYAAPRQEEIDLHGLISMLGDHKKLILFGTALFCLLSILYVVLATPRYEATAVVQVERTTPTVPGVAAATDGDASAQSPAATEIQLLTSRQVLGQAADALHLDIQTQPKRFPVIGNAVARTFSPDAPGAVAEPWFGLSRYGWGGDRVDIARLQVPDDLVGAKLQLIAGENGHYTLADDDGNALAKGVVGQPTS